MELQRLKSELSCFSLKAVASIIKASPLFIDVISIDEYFRSGLLYAVYAALTYPSQILQIVSILSSTTHTTTTTHTALTVSFTPP